MRVLAVALLAVIIAAGGYWLTRGDDSPADASPPPAQNTAAETSPDGTDTTEPASTEPASDEPASDEPATDEPAGEPTPGGADTEPDNDQAATEPATDEAEVVGDAGEAEAGPVVLPDGFTALDYLADAPQQAFDAPEQVLEDGLDYVAVLRTSRGDITVDLYEDDTPVTVNNFVFLALNHYYEDVKFHRVLDGFMAQTGDPTGTGAGGPGYTFDDEIVDSLSFDSTGVLAMANAGPGTNGSQFFLTFGPTPWLDGAHTIFGRVIEGDEVLNSITRLDPDSPNAVSRYEDTVASLAEQGVTLPGEPDETVADAIEALLGTLPVPGQSFNVAGLRAVSGQVGNDPAFGFFAAPDVVTSVVVAIKPLP